MWLPTVLYVVILGRYATVDYGVVFAGYVGNDFAVRDVDGDRAPGFVADAQSVCGVFRVVCDYFDVVSLNFMQISFRRDFGRYMPTPVCFEQFKEFSSGVLDSRSFVYFLSVTLVLLFAAIKSVESHKWR